MKQLKSLILYLNKRFVGALPLLSEEIWSNQVKRINQEKLQLIKCTRHQIDDSEIQAASIDNLRVQLKTLTFAKTSVDKRLEVAEEVISKYEALVNSLQSDMITMEQKYEKLLLEAHNVEIRQLEEKCQQFEKKLAVMVESEKSFQKFQTKLAEKYAESVSKVEYQNVLNKLRDAERQAKIEELGKQMQGLRNQVEDLIDDKTKRDQELEELAKALDSRVQLWKEKIDTKNEKIEELKQKLQQFGNVDSYPNIKVPEETQQEHSELLNALLKKRELQIEQLQNQLLQATQDLNETTALLERKDNVFSKTKITESSELKQKLEEAQQEIGSLQKRVIEAEEDARRKAEETAEMIIQLREYESGTYGLEEAVQQIKELKKLKEARELRIEELIQAGNELGDEANQIELENLELRKQLGISQDTVVRVDGIISRQRQEQKELNLLKKQLETQENLIVDFKVERHELLKKINLLMKEKPTQGSFEEYPEHNDKAIKPYSSVADEEAHILENKLKDVIEENEALRKGMHEILDNEEAHILENKLKDVIEENEALRKGMHEILDSIKETESNSLIRIESTCLERLLEALDSRHVNGWYHPAMRLQAQVFALQGMNTILREELRLARY
ncbi:centrosomal protein of 290 kDa-like [Diaphorina citri]|uniref:Centrosomal protein of 290 kDa-like n=1 Tax=Diaphorina citri TaxID=121845 RepID=A0A3Q0JBB5_DIACI|nr:centrosomal protein of 290 kDa-like [Diaphorina citri]